LQVAEGVGQKAVATCEHGHVAVVAVLPKGHFGEEEVAHLLVGGGGERVWELGGAFEIDAPRKRGILLETGASAPKTP